VAQIQCRWEDPVVHDITVWSGQIRVCI